MKLTPITLKVAKEFVGEHHRHAGSPVGWKFGVGLMLDGEMVGVGVAGRPVSRMLDDGKTIEITRVCIRSDIRNANSMIYGSLLRAAKALGYATAYTYTLASESGASAKAVGFAEDGRTQGGEWSVPSRPRQMAADVGYATGEKVRWRKVLNDE